MIMHFPRDNEGLVRSEAALPNGDSGREVTESHSLFAVLHDRLRGRWKIAIVLGAILGMAFGILAYCLSPVRYGCTGVLQVSSSGAPILRQTPETESLSRYDSTLRTQSILLTSRRVVIKALGSEEVGALAFSREAGALKEVEANLSANVVRNSELIELSYVSDSPTTAAIVLNSILDSYMEVFGGRGDEDFEARMDVLRVERAKLDARREQRRQDIREFLSRTEYGAADLGPVIQGQVLQIAELKHELEQMDLELSGAVAVDETDKSEEATLREPSAAEMMLLVPELADVQRMRVDIAAEIEHLLEIFDESRPQVKKARRRLNLAKMRIDTYEELAREMWAESGGIVASGREIQGLTPSGYLARRDRVAALLQTRQDELHRLNADYIQLEQRQSELDRVEQRLAEIDDRLEELKIESSGQFSGTVRIVERASPLNSPIKDRRRPMAFVAFFGGFGLSFGLFFLLGMIDPRTYGTSQLRSGATRYRCLGVLPNLSRHQIDANLSATASQCVHQIRNRIEVLRDPASSFVAVVTSPYQGDGKTSLAMAIGWSYAAAGFRTILVDSDLCGRHLTRQMGLSDCEGLKEVLRNGRLDSQIAAVPVRNLFVLGVGVDQGFGPESVRRDDFEALCEELRSQYDIVILDTGPFMGSVELLTLATASDGVVFSIRRGRSREGLDESIASLTTIGVPVLGVVLNRADQSDCDHYVSKSAVSEATVKESGSDTKTTKRGRLQPTRNVLFRTIDHTSAVVR